MAGTPYAEITLGFGDGEVAVPVYDQSAAYIVNRAGAFGKELQAVGKMASEDPDRIVALLGDRAYAALCVMIPNLPSRMPEHAFRGFPSKAAMDANEPTDEALKMAPSARQIRAAFRVAIEATGFDFLGQIKDWFNPNLLRAAIDSATLEAIDAVKGPSKPSPSSPPTNGASPSPSSGTTAPASTATTP